MNIARCPGQDRINWTAEDIFDLLCPSCGTAIEYFKDDQCRKCPGCGAVVQNPRFDNGCAAWCAAAENCSIMRGVLSSASTPRMICLLYTSPSPRDGLLS